MKQWQKVVIAVLVVIIIGLAIYPKFDNNLSPDLASAVPCTYSSTTNRCACPIENPSYNGCGNASNAASCDLATCGGNPTSSCKCPLEDFVGKKIVERARYTDGGGQIIDGYKEETLDNIITNPCSSATTSSLCKRQKCTAKVTVRYLNLDGEYVQFTPFLSPEKGPVDSNSLVIEKSCSWQ